MRSMSEFSAYIDLADMEKFSTKITCKEEANRLSGYARSMKDESRVRLKELYWAQRVILSICK